ncbi:MAG: lysoplasmalogenase [Saprospiraceae bacterium]|nr:lysoplasmalogenase [Saprospiraceae bacterium]
MYFSKYKYFNIFYIFVVAFNFISLSHITDYRIVAKPLIMGALIALYISKERNQNNSFILALICALLGDAFLLFTSDEFFLIGLFSFLLMQLLYAGTFWSQRSRHIKDILLPVVIMIILTSILMFVLWPHLDSMVTPVMAYTVAISVMAVAALSRKKELAAYFWVVAGVALFVISDLLLAYGKFVQPLPAHNYLVMGSYMLAQYLIVTGYIESNIQKQFIKST